MYPHRYEPIFRKSQYKVEYIQQVETVLAATIKI
jgi:hypothetical protein